MARQYAIEQGIESEAILIEEVTTITEENLEQALLVSAQEPIESYTIVSDPLHMKRAMLMADDFGMEAHSSPTQTSAIQHGVAKRHSSRVRRFSISAIYS